jgi:hypothetical protein
MKPKQLTVVMLIASGLITSAACNREPTQPPASQTASTVAVLPAVVSPEKAAFIEEGKRLREATTKACAHKAENEIAMETLANEIRQSKARRGAGLDDPLNAEEARNLADMKTLLAMTEQCAKASEAEVAHAAEAQKRAVHAYVNDLKKAKP